MEENEYRTTYKSINPNRCVYEKAINSRQCQCNASERFNLADREGVSCNSADKVERCNLFLEKLRENARFTLQMTQIDGPLPHAKEIRVQVGGMKGLQLILDADAHISPVPDINELLTLAQSRYDDMDNFPYMDLARSLAQFESRPKRQRRK